MKNFLSTLLAVLAGEALAVVLLFSLVLPRAQAPVQQPVGTGNMSLFSSAQKCDLAKLPTSATTTWSIFFNDDADQSARIIRYMVWHPIGASTSTGGPQTFAFGTSTNNNFRSTTANIWVPTSFTTSSGAEQDFTTTTGWASASMRRLEYGQYLLGTSTAPVAFTGGYAGYCYDKVPNR